MKRNRKGSGAFGTKAMLMLGMLAAVLAFGLVLAGCDPEPPGPEVKTYTSTDSSGNMYTLTITDDTSYTLVITYSNGSTSTSTGSVAASSGGYIELQPSSAASGDTFTVTITGGEMTAIAGEITDTDGIGTTITETLTPETGGGTTHSGNDVQDLVDFLGGASYATASDNTVTLIQDVTIGSSATTLLKDGISLVIPVGKTLFAMTEEQIKAALEAGIFEEI